MNKILIIGPSWVGDMVMAQSLFIVLKQQQPDSLIDLLAPAWSLPLISRMPEVHSGIEMPVGHGQLNLKSRKQLAKKLQQKAYNQAIVLPNSAKSALIPFWAKIPHRIGWRGEMRYFLLNDLRPLNKQIFTQTVQRFVALAYPKSHLIPAIPSPHLIVEPQNVIEAVEKYQLKTKKNILTLCPGAEFGEAKRWPTRYYAELAKIYIEKGWQVWLFGSAKDKMVCAEINQLNNNKIIDLSGKTALSEAIDLMSLSKAVVSNDSGLMHIAAALHLPVVAVYGSSDPNFTPPLNKQNKMLSLNLACSPCFQRQCPKGHLNCLNQLEVTRVTQALDELMQ